MVDSYYIGYIAARERCGPTSTISGTESQCAEKYMPTYYKSNSYTSHINQPVGENQMKFV